MRSMAVATLQQELTAARQEIENMRAAANAEKEAAEKQVAKAPSTDSSPSTDAAAAVGDAQLQAAKMVFQRAVDEDAQEMLRAQLKQTTAQAGRQAKQIAELQS